MNWKYFLFKASAMIVGHTIGIIIGMCILYLIIKIIN